MPHLVIVGGSDAGISAALRARATDPAADVTVIVADSFPNYSVCGLPFFLSGEVTDWRNLAHRSRAELETAGISLLLDHRAHSVDAAARVVTSVSRDGTERTTRYDRLLIATGAEPIRPPIPGVDLPGVHLLHSMEDSFRMQADLDERRPVSAVIVGAGYIGLEMADALTRRGISVTVVGRSPRPLGTVDPELGALVEEELVRRGVTVVNACAVESIESTNGLLTVRGTGGERRVGDVVLVSVGVRPSSGLAERIGVPLGVGGAIQVDRRMTTAVPDVFAAGDCVTTWHRVLGRDVYLPLGTTAHKQGRVAGENMAGGRREFPGTLGTQVVKIFELCAARTGLVDEEARLAGFDPVTVASRHSDHKAYYPGASEIAFRITGDRRTGRLLGAQLVGHWRAQVAKRADVFAAALFHGMSVDALSDLDLSYTPPLGSPWDPVQMAAEHWCEVVRPTPSPLP